MTVNGIWLMIIIFGHRGGVGTAEFFSKDSCQTAAQQVMALNVTYANAPTVICVKK